MNRVLQVILTVLLVRWSIIGSIAETINLTVFDRDFRLNVLNCFHTDLWE